LQKELFVIRQAAHGGGSVVFAWDNAGKYLATVGSNRRVHIYRRNGDLFDEFALQEDGPVEQLEWDKDGEVLAVLQPLGQNVTLYEVAVKKASPLSLNQQNASFMCWSKVGAQLAVGTNRGNLILYHKQTRKRVPISGLHSKKIVNGAWNVENKLALCGLDKMVSVSDADGNMLEQTVRLRLSHCIKCTLSLTRVFASFLHTHLDEQAIKSEPADLQFSAQKTDKKKDSVRENTISVNLNQKTLLMYRLKEPEKPIELAFQAKYGAIKSYCWYRTAL